MMGSLRKFVSLFFFLYQKQIAFFLLLFLIRNNAFIDVGENRGLTRVGSGASKESVLHLNSQMLKPRIP